MLAHQLRSARMRHGHRCRARADLQLLQDVIDVLLDGVGRNPQRSAIWRLVSPFTSSSSTSRSRSVNSLNAELAARFLIERGFGGLRFTRMRANGFRDHAAELAAIEAFFFHKGKRVEFFVSAIDVIRRAQRADDDGRDAALMCGAQKPEAVAVVLRRG